MIITENISININPANYNRLKELGYDNLIVGDSIIIPINHLSKSSPEKIKVKCDICNKEFNILYYNYHKNNYEKKSYCKKCKSEENNLKKYGVKNVFQLEETKEKAKKTNLNKRGVEYISQSKETQEKIIQTNLDKHGVTHHFKCKEILDKSIKTNLERYGVDNVSKSELIQKRKEKTCEKNHGVKNYIEKREEIEKIIYDRYGVKSTLMVESVKDKIKKTNKELYGFENPTYNSEIKLKRKNTIIETVNKKIKENNSNIININNEERIFTIFCEKCKSNYDITYALYYKRMETNTCICTTCNPINKHTSGLEINLKYFIEENYKGKIIYTDKNILKPKHLDIYLPELNLAFEFDGVYWHNELYRAKNYHKNKSDGCEKKGIQLIHIWEDDWLYKQDIVKSMILNKLNKTPNKIYARKCVIKEINDNKIVDDFLKQNHLLSKSKYSIKIGLFYLDELVSLMTFKKNKEEYDLNRFCNKIYNNINGSASKLLKYFINKYGDNITTMADRCYSNGNLYKTLGFEKLYDVDISYYYVVSGIRVHKFNFRKKKINKEKLNLTENYIMLKKNIYKIFDAGKIKFKYVKKN